MFVFLSCSLQLYKFQLIITVTNDYRGSIVILLSSLYLLMFMTLHAIFLKTSMSYSLGYTLEEECRRAKYLSLSNYLNVPILVVYIKVMIFPGR